MKKFVLLGLIIFFSCSASFAAYFNDDIPQGAGSFSSNQMNSSSQVSRIGNTYYTPSGTSYTRQGNQIYGSNGTQYTDYGGFIQSSSGKTYQVNNNFVQELQ